MSCLVCITFEFIFHPIVKEKFQKKIFAELFKLFVWEFKLLCRMWNQTRFTLDSLYASDCTQVGDEKKQVF